MPATGVRGTLTESRDFFIFEVYDRGCGVNDEVRRSILTPPVSTEKTRGTGLGLTATIIDKHDGGVSVESQTRPRGRIPHSPSSGRSERQYGGS
jgi:sensor histidine kinase regulating citrate/malate metabolism